MKKSYLISFFFLASLLFATFQPISVLDRATEKRLWLPGPYCILIPRPRGMGLSGTPCGFIRAHSLQQYEENGIFVSIDSLFIEKIGMRYSLPERTAADVFIVQYRGQPLILLCFLLCAGILFVAGKIRRRKKRTTNPIPD